MRERDKKERRDVNSRRYNKDVKLLFFVFLNLLTNVPGSLPGSCGKFLKASSCMKYTFQPSEALKASTSVFVGIFE